MSKTWALVYRWCAWLIRVLLQVRVQLAIVGDYGEGCVAQFLGSPRNSWGEQIVSYGFAIYCQKLGNEKARWEGIYSSY